MFTCLKTKYKIYIKRGQAVSKRSGKGKKEDDHISHRLDQMFTLMQQLKADKKNLVMWLDKLENWLSLNDAIVTSPSGSPLYMIGNTC